MLKTGMGLAPCWRSKICLPNSDMDRTNSALPKVPGRMEVLSPGLKSQLLSSTWDFFCLLLHL